ncbi:MAG: hypothetical protein WBJ42_00250, partial [Thermovirgaceae bacterium]
YLSYAAASASGVSFVVADKTLHPSGDCCTLLNKIVRKILYVIKRRKARKIVKVFAKSKV